MKHYFSRMALVLAAIFTTIGLSIIFLHNNIRGFNKNKNYKKPDTEDTNENNHHFVSMNFGAVSRRLRSNSLESAKLDCKFGALEIFFDQARLNPNGAEVSVNCSFGAIEVKSI